MEQILLIGTGTPLLATSKHQLFLRRINIERVFGWIESHLFHRSLINSLLNIVLLILPIGRIISQPQSLSLEHFIERLYVLSEFFHFFIISVKYRHGHDGGLSLVHVDWSRGWPRFHVVSTWTSDFLARLNMFVVRHFGQCLVVLMNRLCGLLLTKLLLTRILDLLYAEIRINYSGRSLVQLLDWRHVIVEVTSQDVRVIGFAFTTDRFLSLMSRLFMMWVLSIWLLSWLQDSRLQLRLTLCVLWLLFPLGLDRLYDELRSPDFLNQGWGEFPQPL